MWSLYASFSSACCRWEVQLWEAVSIYNFKPTAIASVRFFFLDWSCVYWNQMFDINNIFGEELMNIDVGVWLLYAISSAHVETVGNAKSLSHYYLTYIVSCVASRLLFLLLKFPLWLICHYASDVKESVQIFGFQYSQAV